MKPKIFCIGRNKTGTTSLERAFRDLGYAVGSQREAELLIDDYIAGKYESIIKYCEKSQVFQDFPFSYPETYKFVDQAFPGSKFILTIRDTPEQWYQSLVKFYTKFFGEDCKVPTTKNLKEANYINKGFVWKIHKAIYDVDDNNPFNKDLLIDHYIKYNQEIIDYFNNRPYDLLVINLADKQSYRKFCDFLNIDSPYDAFPWVNKT